MWFSIVNFCVIFSFIGVLCQKSPSITGTGVKEKNEKNAVEVPTPNAGKLRNSNVDFATKRTILKCPDKEVQTYLFPLPCGSNEECQIMGKNMLCCSSRCERGIIPGPEIKTSYSKVVTSVENKEKLVTKSITTIPPIKSPSVVNISNVHSNVSKLICPGKEVPIPIFSLPCAVDENCAILGNKMVCCSNRCVLGVSPSKKTNYSVLNKTDGKEKNETRKDKNSSTRISLPLFQNQEKTPQSPGLVCPEGVWIPIFSLPCKTNDECTIMGTKMICCSSRCIRGVPHSKREIKDSSSQLGMNEFENNKKPLSNPLTPSTVKPTVLISKPPQNLRLVCPGKEVRIPFFSLRCSENEECSALGNGMVCCSNRCVKGVPPPKPEIKHAPSWFGLVERQCPVDPLTEILEIKECQSDADCAPRICCPDKYRNTSVSYCRTAQPSLDKLPIANRFMEPLRVFAGYLQCTPPPPPFLDLFPKSCKNALDCFPNLCCQEGDKKYCRPPKRSLLAFVAGVGQRFVPEDAAKKLIERLN